MSMANGGTTLLCSDLDNTLIYSHRRNLPEPRVLAEYLDGKEQSYITAYSAEQLARLGEYGVMLIPVTTRTREQYERIFVFGQNGIIPCRFALVCNGAVLLRDGEPDEKWLAESMKIAEREFPEVKRIYGKMLETPERDHAKLIEPFLAYMLSERAESLTEELSREADGSLVTVCTHSRKVYCMARSLTKGFAVRRLKEYLTEEGFDVKELITAGDSELDVPMLEAADRCFCADEIAHLVNSDDVTALPHPLSDGICKALTKNNSK